MDPQVIALAKAIRQTESNNNFTQAGKSGEFGAYQWMPDTWKAHAKTALGDENAEMTPSNQNAVAYVTIKQWRDQGLNPAQIAAKWNSGSEANWESKVGTNAKGVAYDVPAYVKKVTDAYQMFKPQGGANPLGVQSAQASTGTPGAQQSGGPSFAYSPTDNPLTSGAKAIGNLPGSLAGFIGNTAQTVNPATALQNLDKIGAGFSELAHDEGYAKAFLDVLKGIPKATYETFVPTGVRDLVSGDTQGAAKAFTEDPFGQAAPVVLGAVGGIKGIDKAAGTNLSGAVDASISGVGGAVADAGGKVLSTTIGKPVKAAVGLGGSLTRSLASHLTSLNPETISQVLADPESFSKIAQDQINRGNIFEAVKSGLAELKDAYSENGKLYEVIKQGEKTVAIPENFLEKTLTSEKYGFKLEADPASPAGVRVVADTKSATRDAADINAIQHFIDNWGNKTEITPKEFLNMRTDLAKMGKYGKEIGRNDVAERVGRDLREDANVAMRPQIKDLRELDSAASPQIALIERVSKDFLDKDSNFKDNAVSKIANALNKEGLLSRLEKLHPGITKQLQILKAVEDIERAKGVKVGAYTRGALEGYGVGTGNLHAIAAAIITNPSVAVPLIRGLGWSAAQTVPLIKILRAVAGDVADKVNDMPASVLAPGVVNQPKSQ